MVDKAALHKALGVFIGGIITFIVNLLILKLGWNAVLTHIFPSLPQITYFQALIIFWICEVLFKQRIVKVAD